MNERISSNEATPFSTPALIPRRQAGLKRTLLLFFREVVSSTSAVTLSLPSQVDYMLIVI